MKKVVFDSTVPVPKTKAERKRLQALSRGFNRHLHRPDRASARDYNRNRVSNWDTVGTFRPPPGVKQSVTKSLKVMGLLGDRTMAVH